MARIYVACLASYNHGVLHGRWIEVDGDKDGDIDDLWSEIALMLRESPHPNIVRFAMECEDGHTFDVGYRPAESCPTCDGKVEVTESYRSAEEWAIHDYENFGGYRVSEGEDLARLVQLAWYIEQHGEWIGDACAYFGNSIGELESMMEHYLGAWENAAEYAADYYEQCGTLKEVPEQLQYHIDWDGVARDMDLVEIHDEGTVHLFNRW